MKVSPVSDNGPSNIFDLAVIGGGINGCGIARDAVGRGLSVALIEKGDLAQGTSSASTKLFHGGLRYLEFYEFRLVREALRERETLLRAMPHISWPMRFVLPHHSGLRPAWFLRLGLFIYDHLGGRKILPPTRTVDLHTDPVGVPLKDLYKTAFEYSDCWVEDSRLVVLNARDAADRGAAVYTRTCCERAERADGVWQVTLRNMETGAVTTVWARALVNAGGPWVDQVIQHRLGLNMSDRIRLVRGSHIVTRRLFEHDRAYIFQNADGRIVFAIPYESDYTLIGTTDVDHDQSPEDVSCSKEEAAYLRDAASQYFERPIEEDDIVWTYSGVRPLYDDGAKSATAATRDYVLKVEDQNGTAPLLSIFGGKITTYRRLAEAVLAKLSPYFVDLAGDWTAGVPLPGGGFDISDFDRLIAELRADRPWLDQVWAKRLVRAYGTQAAEILSDVHAEADMGTKFGWNLTAREVDWLMVREWARTADDVLWRRSKVGLRFSPAEMAALESYMSIRLTDAGDRNVMNE